MPSRRNLALCEHGQEETQEEIRKEAHQKEACAKACGEADRTSPCRESHQRAGLTVAGPRTTLCAPLSLAARAVLKRTVLVTAVWYTY